MQVTQAAFPLITNRSYPSDGTECPGEGQSLTALQKVVLKQQTYDVGKEAGAYYV